MFRSDQIGRLVGAVALALIAGALSIQYLGHVQPCKMCHWQRWALLAAAAIGLLGIPLWKKEARLLAAAAILLMAISGTIAAYQTGEQFGLFPELKVCEADAPYVLGSVVGPAVLCSNLGWTLFGLSLAAYNALISLTVAALGAIGLRKSKDSA